ncbi:MAG: AraC family transcriptional regulator [Candidatus Pristimantibacillus sp.]
MAIFNYNQDVSVRDEPDLYLQHWGKEDCVPGHAVGPGVRDVYKIHFVHKGKGTLKVADQSFSLSAGQAFLIYPHIVTYYEADEADPWTYSWIGFYGIEAANAIANTVLTPASPVFLMDVRLMPGLYEQLNEAASYEGSGSLRLKVLMYDFLSVLVDSNPLSAVSNRVPKKQDVYVHQGLEFIHSHYCEDISVKQLAALLGLDRKYLSAIFKEAVGVPPQQYLLNYRMDKACELLGKGLYSVGEVSRSVGYQDALLFSRMFKKVKGIPPKSFMSILNINDINP